MIRRRRRVREIPFSFDSFLDVVANVVGIIIRLILVVWVGARSYSSVQQILRQPARVTENDGALALPAELQKVGDDQAQVQGKLAQLTSQEQNLEETSQLLDHKASDRDGVRRTIVF